MAVETKRLLSQLSYFKIGGPAKLYLSVETIEQMQEALLFARREQIPYIVIGKGSNCLFSDEGYDGLIIHNKIHFIEQYGCSIYVGAGYNFSRLGALTARRGLSGLEFASGIPATVGGAIYMNAGASGRESCQPLTFVDYLSPEGELIRYKREDIHFSYRSSSFQTLPGAIVAAEFALTRSDAAREEQIGIARYRQASQPYDMPSAGCIFRNPAKGSAGALIDKLGLKGLSIGGAKISTKHANFIVNDSGATSRDVLSLIALIKEQVYRATQISLISEVIYIPFQGVEQGILHG